MRKAAFSLLLFAVPGCAMLPPVGKSTPSIKLSFNEKEMRTEVEKNLSVGMPVETAKAILEGSGFKCEDITYESKGPHLRCIAVYQPWLGFFRHPLCADVIQVNLFYVGTTVIRIEVACYGAGP